MSPGEKSGVARRADCTVAMKVVFGVVLVVLVGAVLGVMPQRYSEGSMLLSADANDPNQPPMPAKPFALVVFLDEIDDAIFGQRCVFPVTVVDEGTGAGAGEPVNLSLRMMSGQFANAVVTIEPNEIRPGEVAEVTITPIEPNEPDPNSIRPRPNGQPVVLGEPGEQELERKVFVDLLAERGGVSRTRMIEVNVFEGEDYLPETAAFYRDLFVPWLAKHHPELQITGQTEWTGTAVRPHILVVTYYLFFSPEWEMGLRWHVMIPPHDWAEIYLRHRGELSSTRAWRIHSVAGGLEPQITELPTEGIFR